MERHKGGGRNGKLERFPVGRTKKRRKKKNDRRI